MARTQSSSSGRSGPVILQVCAKAMWARGAAGLLTAKRVPAALEQKLPCQLCAQSGHASRNCPNQRRRPRYARWSQDLAAWNLFEVDTCLDPGALSLCVALVASSEQGAVGLVVTDDGRKSAGGYPTSALRSTGPFNPITSWDEEQIRRCSQLNAPAPSEEAQLARAIALSLSEQSGQDPLLTEALEEDEDAALQAALMVSLEGTSAAVGADQVPNLPKATTKDSKRSKAGEKKASQTPADMEVAEAIAALARRRPGGVVNINELNQ
ncbi:unnamed protein product, partial [Symbiodinium sp. KB8]